MVDEGTPDPAPRAPDVDENGVDLAQIRAMLDRKPGERLSFATAFMNSLVELKEKAGRPKDLAVLPILRATLAETRRRS